MCQWHHSHGGPVSARHLSLSILVFHSRGTYTVLESKCVKLKELIELISVICELFEGWRHMTRLTIRITSQVLHQLVMNIDKMFEFSPWLAVALSIWISTEVKSVWSKIFKDIELSIILLTNVTLCETWGIVIVWQFVISVRRKLKYKSGNDVFIVSSKNKWRDWSFVFVVTIKCHTFASFRCRYIGQIGGKL